MANTKISTNDINDDAVETAKIADDAVTNAKIGALAVDTTELAADAVEVDQLNDALLKVTAMVNIEDPAVQTYSVVLSMPFDFSVQDMAYVCTTADGSNHCTFEVEIDNGTATDVTFTGPVTSFNPQNTTMATTTATANNTGSAGDLLQINVTAVTGTPVGLQIQLNLKRTAL